MLDKLAKYYYFKYLPLMPEAIKNAKAADTNPAGYMPEPLQTKVYRLAQTLYNRIGKKRFEEFVASLPSRIQRIANGYPMHILLLTFLSTLPLVANLKVVSITSLQLLLMVL